MVVKKVNKQIHNNSLEQQRKNFQHRHSKWEVPILKIFAIGRNHVRMFSLFYWQKFLKELQNIISLTSRSPGRRNFLEILSSHKSWEYLK